MPTNLYGPNDNFDLQSQPRAPGPHAQSSTTPRWSGVRGVEVSGSGTPRRELLHVDDLADACVFLMDHYEGAGHINVGSWGSTSSIRELAEAGVRDAVVPRWRARVRRPSKPDGSPGSCST